MYTEKQVEEIAKIDENIRKKENMVIPERYFLSGENEVYAQFLDTNPVLIHSNNEWCY